MRIIIILIMMTGFSALTGCASIVSGTHQQVCVNTGPVMGANCTLENNKGKWYVPQTPGSVVVNRSFNDLKVECRKPGYQSTMTTVGSNTKPIAFGNVLFGGVVGAGIDVADGAAYAYPDNIDVQMLQKKKRCA